MNGTEPGALPTAANLHRTTPALDGASVETNAGQGVAVTGPSGSGKSTLPHRLATIVAPDRGSVRYAEHGPTTMSDRSRSARVVVRDGRAPTARRVPAACP
ncbi:ATP-binding cassette domain-containing protein [Streptomyces sp. SID3343]|nr:ATP-binding cassette domain-containing protein [Streptomyces sp. SID3343]